ncbi:MAG: radical SAM protein [Bryobacterales bacterium]|nr:radical SAM protein [Bryobacteraceae bacterium]MDW8353916.1 radical SAM protein [Bryobacterales bacterium]
MSSVACPPAQSGRLPIFQPETTYAGSPIQPLKKGLPKSTQSLCPECVRLVEARLFEEGGKVIMEKTCPEHGLYRDVVYSDVRLYLKMEEWHFGDNRGVENPAIPNATRCPEQCGLCSMHLSHTSLANIDLTNRCNLTCPVCFANANAAGYLYEPSFEQVRRMLQTLRNERPVAGRIVQFSGGEPTLYPRFLDAVRLARQMGFTHIQVATNGLRFAELEFAQACEQAGLHTLYLQFDGVTDDVYRRTRGRPLLETKLRVIENVRKVGLKICLVPTIVKGINDHQIGDIIRLAIDNIDVISAVSFQPVSFCGRISRQELEAKRFTQSDLAHAVHQQTGLCDPYEDWFPLACVAPFSRFLGALRGEEAPTLTPHPHCSMGTYLFVDPHKRAVPVTRFVDVGGMMRDLDQLARRIPRQRIKLFSKVRAWQALRRHFHADRAPEGLTFQRFLRTLQGFTDKRYGRGQLERKGYTYKTLMVASMHFMDVYNYDVERVRRCVIHYAAPNGLLYPFCAYNAGPTFREKIEKKYSRPLERPSPRERLVAIGARRPEAEPI